MQLLLWKIKTSIFSTKTALKKNIILHLTEIPIPYEEDREIINNYPKGKVNSGGYIPTCKASRYISSARHRPWGDSCFSIYQNNGIKMNLLSIHSMCASCHFCFNYQLLVLDIASYWSQSELTKMDTGCFCEYQIKILATTAQMTYCTVYYYNFTNNNKLWESRTGNTKIGRDLC